VQGLDALDGGVGQFAAALAAHVGGAERSQVSQQTRAQRPLHAVGQGVRGQLAAAQGQRPTYGDKGEGHQEGRDAGEVLSIQEDAADGPAQPVSLGDEQQRAQCAQADGGEQRAARTVHLAQQTPVKVHDQPRHGDSILSLSVPYSLTRLLTCRMISALQ